MDLDVLCHLCLGKNPSFLQDSTPPPQIIPEDVELRRKIDRVFYFEIFRGPTQSPKVCVPCAETVDRFYQYAQEVSLNQELIRGQFGGPSTSRDMKVHIKQEVDPEWVGVQALCQTVGGNPEVGEDEYEQYEGLDSEVDIKKDHDWDEDVGGGDDGGLEEESSFSEGEDTEEEEEEVVKPKRKYTKRKQSVATPKKPKKEKDNQRNHAKEEFVLQHFTLMCDICSEQVSSFKELRGHFREIHDEEAYVRCCDKKIYKSWVIIEHYQLHIDPHAFHCEMCNKDYSTSRVLKEHLKEVHAPLEARPFKCDTCLKQFVSRSHLNAHIQVSHGSFQCPQCPSMLASKSSLTKHITMMHGEGERYVCDICARVFRYKQGLDKHVKNHLGTRVEEKVQCNICSSWFTDQNCLNKHIRRIHVQTDLASLACDMCGHVARNQNALYCHKRRMHTEEKFECEMCGKKFRRVNHMREHVAIHHTGADLYGCNYCPERFNAKNKQLLHRKTAHPVEWEEEMRKRALRE